MKKYCFGVDIGGTFIKIGLFDITGELIEKWEIPTRIEENAKYILPDAAKSIFDKMAERSIAKEEVIGIGYGVPAPVSDGVVEDAANLGWKNKEVSKELTELTGFPANGGNDVNIAALGELWKGAAKGHKNLVMLTIGTGVGGAIVADGRIVTGESGGAGEIGHIHVEDQCEVTCGCGGRGCMEQYASATGIVRMTKKLLAESDMPSVLRGEEITAKTVFDAVKAGDALAMEIAEKFGKYIGMALGAVAATVEPEVFIVGGGVSKAGPVLITYIQKYYKAYAWPGIRNKPIVLAQLGNDAGIYGAAGLFLKDL